MVSYELAERQRGSRERAEVSLWRVNLIVEILVLETFFEMGYKINVSIRFETYRNMYFQSRAPEHLDLDDWVLRNRMS